MSTMEATNGVTEKGDAPNGAADPVINPSEDNVDRPTPWLEYIVDSINRKPPEPTATMPVERDAVYYNMNHKHRGIALLFNHEDFEPDLTLKQRLGTNHDFENLKNCLTKLGFEIWSYHDSRKAEVQSAIQKAANEDHKDKDCLLVAVFSHGEQGTLYAHDTDYKAESLWTPFAADKCPSLAGKPKLFFIQACQGDMLDSGVQMQNNIETDSGVSSYKSYKIPFHDADFLIAYSTIPGYVSWRNKSEGSWFMQALCQALTQNGFVLDLLAILTFVNQRVAIDYESDAPDDPTMHQQKQIPCVIHTLTRLVKFTHKSL